MKKILVIGGNGSGKTTFSKELSKKTKLPLIHLDSLYWKDNWEHVLPYEFDLKLMDELQKESFIMDGNMKRTLPLRLKYCDTVILFDFPTIVCLFGAIKRSVLNYGKSREDMGGKCPEKIDLRFYKSIWCGNKNMMKSFYEMTEKEKGINVIIIKSRREAKEILEKI